MDKINIAIDTRKDSFIIYIYVDGKEIQSFERNDKDISFLSDLIKILKEYGC